MNKKVKSLLIVFPLSFLFAGLAVLCYLLDPAFVPDAYRVSSMILVVLWCFFIIPTILFAVQWIKKTVKKLRLNRGFAAEYVSDFCWGSAEL